MNQQENISPINVLKNTARERILETFKLSSRLACEVVLQMCFAPNKTDEPSEMLEYCATQEMLQRINLTSFDFTFLEVIQSEEVVAAISLALPELQEVTTQNLLNPQNGNILLYLQQLTKLKKLILILKEEDNFKRAALNLDSITIKYSREAKNMQPVLDTLCSIKSVNSIEILNSPLDYLSLAQIKLLKPKTLILKDIVLESNNLTKLSKLLVKNESINNLQLISPNRKPTAELFQTAIQTFVRNIKSNRLNLIELAITLIPKVMDIENLLLLSNLQVLTIYLINLSHKTNFEKLQQIIPQMKEVTINIFPYRIRIPLAELPYDPTTVPDYLVAYQASSSENLFIYETCEE